MRKVLKNPEELEKFYAANLWSKPGQHILEVGATGTGKTNGLYYALDMIRRHNPKERIIWLDSCKSSEIAILASLYPIKLHIPYGCEIQISEVENNRLIAKVPGREDILYWRSPRELWTNIMRQPLELINIISLKRYCDTGASYVRTLNTVFEDKQGSGGLLNLIKEYEVMGPLAIFLDEAQDISPSKEYEYDSGHYAMGRKLQFMIDQMRSERIRLVAATQAYTRMLKGIRSQFQWNMARRGAEFKDTTMEQYYPLFKKLEPSEAIILDPNNEWPKLAPNKVTVLDLPFYGDGIDVWTVRYPGTITVAKDARSYAPALG